MNVFTKKELKTALTELDIDYKKVINKLEENQDEAQIVSIKSITTRVCNKMNVDKQKVIEKSNKIRYAWPRQIIMSIAYLQGHTCHAIAKFFSRPNHSIVFYSLRTLRNLIYVDKSKKAEFESIYKKTIKKDFQGF